MFSTQLLPHLSFRAEDFTMKTVFPTIPEGWCKITWNNCHTHPQNGITLVTLLNSPTSVWLCTWQTHIALSCLKPTLITQGRVATAAFRDGKSVDTKPEFCYNMYYGWCWPATNSCKDGEHQHPRWALLLARQSALTTWLGLQGQCGWSHWQMKGMLALYFSMWVSQMPRPNPKHTGW